MLTAGQVVPMDMKGLVPETYRVHRTVDATGAHQEQRSRRGWRKKSRPEEASDDEIGDDDEEDSFYETPFLRPRKNKTPLELRVEAEGMLMKWNHVPDGVQLLPERVLGELYTRYATDPEPEEPSSFRGESAPRVD